MCRVSDSTVGSPTLRRARVLVDGPGGRRGAARPVAVAQAVDTFRFHGSGYGHGIGMSQWGAYGLAHEGLVASADPHALLLRHARRGAPRRCRRRSASGSLAAVRTIHLGARKRAGPAVARRTRRHVRREDPVRGDVDRLGRAGRAQVRDPRRHAARWSAGVRWGGPARPLFATFAGTGARVFVPEADDVWHQGYAYAYGFLEFDLTGCADRCVERLTIELPFEDYLRGMGEMPSSWPTAALRTQAVAARTFATYKIRRYGLRSDCDCHLLDGVGRPGLRRVEQGERARRRPMGRRGGRHAQGRS